MSFFDKDLNLVDVEYLSVAKKILEFGKKREDRTGTGTLSLFGPRMEFSFKNGFPILTTKRIPFRIVAEELLWFIKGDTNLKTLLEKNVNIWNDDAYRFYLEQGGKLSKEAFLEMVRNNEGGFDLGPIYGYNFRRWEGSDGKVVDQLGNVIKSIKEDPYSRRHVLTLWNPTVLDRIALPSCHGTTIQFYVSDGELSCQVYIRSNDIFLGNPFNISSYALLTSIIAAMTGLEPDRLILTIGDAHIYLNHIEQVKEQLKREPKKLPTLKIKRVYDRIEDFSTEDFELVGYDPHPTIKGKLSVGL